MSFLGLFKKSPKKSVDLSRLTSSRPRHKCPFYGFYYGGIPNAFVDSKGNQCAAVISAHGPCQMELKGETPDWNKCPVNSEGSRENIESIKDSSRVFPKEFWPTGKPGWEGISLKQWMEYVMSDKVPRPQ